MKLCILRLIDIYQKLEHDGTFKGKANGETAIWQVTIKFCKPNQAVEGWLRGLDDKIRSCHAETSYHAVPKFSVF